LTSEHPELSHLCIIGLGLMGGSLAMALKAAGWAQPITGVSRSADTLAAAQRMGVIDAGTPDLAEGVKGAGAVILATPVRTLLRQIPEVGRHAGRGTLVLDMGSTKTEVCASLDRLPAGIEPVGGHPMCGKETAGFAAADAALYRGKTFVLCPLPRTGHDALKRAREIAEAVGSQVVVLDPASHDRAVAAISHLPYLAAAALVNTVTTGNDPLAWALAASGFRDTTRVAASDVDMMLDILLTNREAILGWLGGYALKLAVLQQALSTEDEAALRAYLSEAQAMRAKLHVA
jgi:prephenate dehydrogenase